MAAKHGKQEGRSSSKGKSEALIDHDSVRNWVEKHGGKPTCVKGTGGERDPGLLRIDFPGYSGEQSLQPISWDEFFEKFDEQNLALITQRDPKSNFNKLVSRDNIHGRPGEA